jgi:hypothetical protein
MDLSDLFQPVASGPALPKARNRREEIASAVVVFGFPLIALVLLTVTDLSKRPDIAMLWMPVGFSVAGAVICAGVRMGLWRAFVSVLGCLWWCLLAGTALVVIDILIFPF